MSGVDNLDYMYSINTNNGMMTLYNYFDLKTEANTDQILSQMRESQAESAAPEGCRQLRGYGGEIHLVALIMFALYSPTEPTTPSPRQLLLHQHQRPDDPDQGDRQRYGIWCRQYAMRLWVDPDTLAKLNITVPEIMNAVNAQNREPVRHGGRRADTQRSGIHATLSGPRKLQTEEEFGNIVLRANPDGSIVRVRDVARIELGPRTTTCKVASTESRAPSSPSSRCREPMLWMPPLALKS